MEKIYYPNSRNRRSILFYSLLALYIMSLINWQIPVLRFTTSVLNHLYLTLVMSIPFGMVMIFFIRKHRSLTLTNYIVAISIGTLSFLLTLSSMIVTTQILHADSDLTFKQIHAIDMTHSVLKVYRTDGGATTAYGIVIRQEKTLMPGIVLVRDLYDGYRCDEIGQYSIDGDTITMDIRCLETARQTFTLNRFVYF